MIKLGSIIRKFGLTYIQQYSPPALHLKVLQAISQCRTSSLGGHAWACTTCGGVHIHYNSCGNRHCPNCQAFEKEKWVEARKQELLPVPYLHLVFTLPHELNPLVLSNDRLIYNLLFKATWQTIRQLSADPRWLGAASGMIAVLHTWGSNLSLHPHLHCIFPCGGLNTNQTEWIATKKKHFLAPNKTVIAPIFRAKFMNLLIQSYEQEQLVFYGSASIYEELKELRELFSLLQRKNWNVYAKKPFGGPAQIINYLSRYTHRIAISNQRIVALNGTQLTFSVKNYKQLNKKGLPKVTTLNLCVFEFLRRFLLHVLPSGFHRIRYFGLLAIRNRKTKLREAQRLLQYQVPPKNPLDWKQRLVQLTGQDPDVCPFCQQKTVVELGFISRYLTPIGRAPPQTIYITTPQGEQIPLST